MMPWVVLQDTVDPEVRVGPVVVLKPGRRLARVGSPSSTSASRSLWPQRVVMNTLTFTETQSLAKSHGRLVFSIVS